MVGTPTSSITSAQPRDPLTGLGGVLECLNHLTNALAHAVAVARPIAFLELSLDQPDSESDYSADEALVEFVGIVRAVTMRQVSSSQRPLSASIFRIGSNELAILLPDTGRVPARRIAAAIHDATDLTVNIGIGVAEPEAIDLGALLLAANGALRAARSHSGRRVRLLATAPQDAVGAIGVVTWLARHTADAAQRLEEISHLAMTDPLTGLPNQRALDPYLQAELGRALRYGRPFALLLIDGDNLRQYNERLGYASGDDWIKRLAILLHNQIRTNDFVARWRTGDEFIVALPETGRDAASHVAERTRRAVEVEMADFFPPATVSIGIAAFPDDGMTPGDLLASVESATRTAKQLGKNRIAFPHDSR